MAKNETDQADIFLREVDDDYKRGQLEDFWKRYGATVIAGVSLLLIAAGAYLLWQNYQDKAINAQADTYVKATKALDAGDTATAQPILQKLAESGTPGYRALSQLDLASAQFKNGKAAEAVKQYQAISDNSSIAKPFRDFASLRAIMIRYEDMKPAEAITALKPLAQENSAWFGTAGELLAIAYMRDNKPADALPVFEALAANPDVPQTVKIRAKEMQRLLGSQTNALPASKTTTAAKAL